MILAFLVFKLQLTSHPDGGHFVVFANMAAPLCRPFWRNIIGLKGMRFFGARLILFIEFDG